MPRFVLEYTAEFPNGRVIQLPGDVPLEEWPYLQFETLPTITSADGAVGTPITADDGALSDPASTMMPQWEADGVVIPDPDASFTPDSSYVGKKIRRRVAVEGWTLVAYSNEITVVPAGSGVIDFPFPIVVMPSVWRPGAQTTWFTPVVKFTGMSGGELEWTTSSSSPIPESQVEVVTQTGPAGEYQIFMRDPAKNNPGASPRVDYSVFGVGFGTDSEAARRALLKFRWRPVVGTGTWSNFSAAVNVPLVSTTPPPEVGDDWLPASARGKDQYEAEIVGSQGQQYQRCRTWNLGVIDPAKRGWIVSAQDENGLRFAKNGTAGGDGDPIKWGFPRLDGFYGSKSGGLYLDTDDNAGVGLFLVVSGRFDGGGFGQNDAAIGVYVGDGTLTWARKLNLTRPSGPGPYVSGSSGPKKAFTNGGPTGSKGDLEYFGNAFDRQGNFCARRPQVPEMMTCSVFKTTKALLDADLSYPAGTTAAVYADASMANRAVYTKTGASGAGSWTKTIELLTDAQRPLYVLEQHGSTGSSVTYQALFKSTDGGASFAFVRDFDAAYRGGDQGLYGVIVAPNGDVMIYGVKGAWISQNEGVAFTQRHTRPVSDAHFFGGNSTTVSSARIGDDSANSNGGVYAAANARSSAFAKPTAADGTANKGLPANFNVWQLACAPTNPNLLLVNSDITTAYRSTDGGKTWGAVTSAPSVPGEIDSWRFDFRGKKAQGQSGWIFCPTNANLVHGWTFQTTTFSINGGQSFQGYRAMFFDGMHNKGTGTGPLTGANAWKKLITNSQDSLTANWLDGMNYMERCGSGTGDTAFRDALEAAGAGNKGYVSGNGCLLMPTNLVVCVANRDTGAQSNVVVILSDRQPDGKYPTKLVKNLSGKTTKGFLTGWSLADPDGYAFLGRWGVGNVTATEPANITFDDHSGHEYVGQRMDGATQVSYWAGTGQNPTEIYLSDHPKGLNGQTTPWKATSGSYWLRAICIDPHTSERVLYVSNNDKSVIREIKRVSGSLVDSTLKDASGDAVDMRPLIEADLAGRIAGFTTLPANDFADISQLMCDPNMPGLFYCICGIHGIPNLWMTVDNGLHWTNESENLPRTFWYGTVHPLTGDVLLDSSLGRHIKPPPAGYPPVTDKGKLSAQLDLFYGNSTRPPVF